MDSQLKNYYNVGGSWSNSSYEGSLFIRPEFGNKTNQFPVSVEAVEDMKLEFNMFPNPSNSIVNLSFYSDNNTVTVRSMVGVVVSQFNCGFTSQFEVSSLPTGLYLVEVKDLVTQKSSVKKLLIQH
jgi:hypothetical protein